MSEHTPGPWTSASGSVWKGDPFADPKGAYKIGGADRDEPRTLPVERDDNVRLMAAAPSLLTALERCEDRLSAWAEYEKLCANREANHMRAAQHHNRADNYGALVDQAREAIEAAT